MANAITIARLPFLIIIILLFFSPSPVARVITVPSIVLLIVMDTIDGLIARSREEVSVLGSVLDIMADRAVELVLWVVYAHLRLIPLAIPIICILRGTIVDSLRSVTVQSGEAPFESMQTDLGRWLVARPFMRTTYALAKAIAFAGLAFTHALAAYAARGAVSENAVTTSSTIFLIVSWLAVAFCLARGLPVVIEALLPLAGRDSSLGHTEADQQ